MLKLQEVELLAQLLSRAPITPVEATWANMILDRLRASVVDSADQELGARAPFPGQNIE